MKKYIPLLMFVLSICLFCVCGKQFEKQKEEKESGKDLVIHTEKEKKQPADNLTLEQKVGQLFIVCSDALNPLKKASKDEK